jgi:hypothetical protein
MKKSPLRTITLRTVTLIVVPALAIVFAKTAALTRQERLIAQLESKTCVVVAVRPAWATWLPNGEVANQSIGTIHSRGYLSTDAEHRQPFDRVVEIHCHSPIAEKDVAVISTFADVDRLDLSHTGTTDAGARHLARLKSLAVLSLKGNPVGDSAAVHLVNNLHKLKILDLEKTNVTDACVQKIRQSYPQIVVLGK